MISELFFATTVLLSGSANENEEGNNSPRFAFKHFHNYTNAGIRDNSNPTKRSHSFFGLLYYTPNNDGEGVVHPSSPQN